jgi:hypothetical protein
MEFVHLLVNVICQRVLQFIRRPNVLRDEAEKRADDPTQHITRWPHSDR